MNIEQVELLDLVKDIHVEKQRYQDLNSELAISGEKELNIPKERFRRVKDYQHYKGLGWLDSPVGKLDPKVMFPDRITPVFYKLIEIVKDLSSVGMLYMLEDYISAANLEGVEIKINIPQKEYNERFSYYVDQMDKNQGIICNLANQLRDEYKPKFRELNISPERDFNSVVRLYSDLSANKDIHDEATNILVDSNMIGNTVGELEMLQSAEKII